MLEEPVAEEVAVVDQEGDRRGVQAVGQFGAEPADPVVVLVRRPFLIDRGPAVFRRGDPAAALGQGADLADQSLAVFGTDVQVDHERAHGQAPG